MSLLFPGQIISECQARVQTHSFPKLLNASHWWVIEEQHCSWTATAAGNGLSSSFSGVLEADKHVWSLLLCTVNYYPIIYSLSSHPRCIWPRMPSL